MKELFRFSNQIKPKASLYFAGFLAIFGVANLALGYKVISIITLFQMMLVALFIALIEHYLFLNYDELSPIQKKSHTVIWAVATNILIIGGAIVFQWAIHFPAWMIGILILMVEISLVFFRYSVYLKNLYDTKMLNEKLQKYQQKP